MTEKQLQKLNKNQLHELLSSFSFNPMINLILTSLNKQGERLEKKNYIKLILEEQNSLPLSNN